MSVTNVTELNDLVARVKKLSLNLLTFLKKKLTQFFVLLH